MKQQKKIKAWSAAILVILILALAVPGWGQARGPVLSSKLETGGGGELDVWRDILVNSSSPKVSRGTNGHYYAVVQLDAHHLGIRKNTGNPAVTTWTPVTIISSNDSLRGADIEVLYSENSCHVVYVEGSAVKNFRFNLSNPAITQTTTVYGPLTGVRLDECSLTSSELDSAVQADTTLLFACWRMRTNTSGVYTVATSRSLTNGSTWINNYNWSVGTSCQLPGGNANAFCPSNDRVFVSYTDANGDVRIAKSSPLGVGPWTWTTIMAHPTAIINSWGITSAFGGYILTTADAIYPPSTNYDVLYKYSTDGGTTWLGGAGITISWLGNQRYPSCASNDNGYFNILYYNAYSFASGVAHPQMESRRIKWDQLGNTALHTYGKVDDTHSSFGAPNACIDDPAIGLPNHGGAYQAVSGTTLSSFFGWADMLPSPWIVIPANHPGLSLKQIDFTFPGATQINSNHGLAVINVDCLYVLTNYPIGFLNMATDSGWVLRNIPIDAESSTVNKMVVGFQLPNTPGTNLDCLEVYAAVSDSVLLEFNPPAIRSTQPIAPWVYNAGGLNSAITTVSDRMQNSLLVFLETSHWLHWRLVSQTNIEQDFCQCYPAAVANGLQYLDAGFGVPVPHTHHHAVRDEHWPFFLVCPIETYMERIPHGDWPFSFVEPIDWPKGVYAGTGLNGLLEYLDVNGLENWVHVKHKNRVGGSGIGYLSNSNVSVGSATSLVNNDPAVNIVDWIFDELENEETEITLLVQFGNYPFSDGGHAVAVMSSGSVGGVRYLICRHDQNQGWFWWNGSTSLYDDYVDSTNGGLVDEQVFVVDGNHLSFAGGNAWITSAISMTAGDGQGLEFVIDPNDTIMVFDWMRSQTNPPGPGPDPEFITIINTGYDTLDWFVQENINWLNITPMQGGNLLHNQSAALTCTIDTSQWPGLGTFTGNIIINVPGGIGSPDTIPIVLHCTNVVPLGMVQILPNNPPLVIPATGGMFSFTAKLYNMTPNNLPLEVWVRQKNFPSGPWQTVLGPVSLNMPGAAVITRGRNQNVPATANAGSYIYRGYMGDYPNVVWDSSDFTYYKLGTSLDVTGSEGWLCTGEPFPGEEMAVASTDIPKEFALLGASPNPFNPTTTISFQLPSAERVRLAVYDISGRLVTTLVDGQREAGTHQVTFDGSNLSSGVYLYSLTAGAYSATGKMALVK